jgi:geranylgeranyl pyrophosphate synthase
MFAEESQIGKSALADLAEAKKTLLVWYAWRHSSLRLRKELHGLLTKKTVTTSDLLNMRLLLMNSGALDFCRRQIKELSDKAEHSIASLAIPSLYRQALSRFNHTVIF